MKLEGLPRHASTHAAGVVIGDRPLDELVPLYRDPRSDMPVTQFDMKYVEAAGLVKFDFLGLKTLSVLKEGQRLLAEQGVEVDFGALPWDDPAVYELLQRGDTVGVFQLESEGMRRTLSAVRPTSFGDIIALVALYRPGPMDNIPMFGDRKNGRAAIEYPHPLLEGILAETYGIFVYQEQVMQAAQVLAGYSLGEADLLRRAMGKKIKSEMDAQRATLRRGLRGAQRHPGGQGERAVRLDRQVRRLRLQQEPRRRLRAGRLSDRLAEGAPPRRILRRVDELRHGADRQARRSSSRTCAAAGSSACRPTSTPATRISRSRTARSATRSGALKGVGEKAMEALVEERERGGPFASLEDFAARIDPRLLNRRQLESLAGAGAFDSIKPDRAAVFAARRDDPRPCRERARPARPAGRPACSAAIRPKPRRSACRAMRHGRWRSAWRPSATPSASISRRIRSMRRGTCSPRTRCETFAELADMPHRRGRARRRDHGRRWSRTRAGGPRPRAAAT